MISKCDLRTNIFYSSREIESPKRIGNSESLMGIFSQKKFYLTKSYVFNTKMVGVIVILKVYLGDRLTDEYLKLYSSFAVKTVIVG